MGQKVRRRNNFIAYETKIYISFFCWLNMCKKQCENEKSLKILKSAVFRWKKSGFSPQKSSTLTWSWHVLSVRNFIQNFRSQSVYYTFQTSEKQSKNFRANMHFNECTRTIFTASTWNIEENYRLTVVTNKKGAIGLLGLQYFVLLYLSSHDFWSCHNLTSGAVLLQNITFSSYFSWSF